MLRSRQWHSHYHETRKGSRWRATVCFSDIVGAGKPWSTETLMSWKRPAPAQPHRPAPPLAARLSSSISQFAFRSSRQLLPRCLGFLYFAVCLLRLGLHWHLFMAAGLGEAASIAGLLSLAGQTLQAASTIYTFIHNYKGVSAEIDSVAGHVLRLQDLLVHVQKLMTNADLLNPPSPDMLARLRTGIATCQADLITWNGRIEALRNSQLSRPKKLLQKVKIASDHRFFSPIRSDISAHFQNLSTILGLLTWYA